MLVATVMFALFSAFLLVQGARTRARVRQLRGQLDVIEKREAEDGLVSAAPSNQLSLPQAGASKRHAAV
jgi:hypothetical protein